MNRIYPVNYGFKVSVEILRDDTEDTARVKVIAPVYVNKEWFMSHSYKSSQFPDHAILNDHSFLSVLAEHFPA